MTVPDHVLLQPGYCAARSLFGAGDRLGLVQVGSQAHPQPAHTRAKLQYVDSRTIKANTASFSLQIIYKSLRMTGYFCRDCTVHGHQLTSVPASRSAAFQRCPPVVVIAATPVSMSRLQECSMAPGGTGKRSYAATAMPRRARWKQREDQRQLRNPAVQATLSAGIELLYQQY